MRMHRVLLLLVVMSIAGCGPADRTESGAITSVAEDAKQARTAAQDAVAAAEAAARRDEAASQIKPDGE
jgi:hypothetical protein